MKIPEGPANVGAYYGNEENGQWQPNGVLLDSNVSSGVVGGGDAGLHRPPVYPVHIPRGHIPGYVMAGAYYPPAAYPPVPPAPADDFADYMWMENEEEFDKQVMQQLEEEALMEQCIEAMLEDEQRERRRPVTNGHAYPTTSNGASSLSIEETVSRSTLNPLAAEFVPTRVRQAPAASSSANSVTAPATNETAQVATVAEAKQNTTEVTVTENSSTEEPSSTEQRSATVPNDDSKSLTESGTAEELNTSTNDNQDTTAEVQSDATKAQEKRPKETKKEQKPKPDLKKIGITKPESKPKTKPQPVKSETKTQTKKKDLKVVKSESNIEEPVKIDEVVVPTPIVETKPQTLPQNSVEEPLASSAMKPINYAAAAKANKPKPKLATPPMEKTPPPQQPVKTTEKNTKPVEKSDKKPPSKVKTDRQTNPQRKNSTK